MSEGRLIAIGDIHGCAAALAALLDALVPEPLDTLIFLGDYIDRGPDSRGVIDRVMSLKERCTLVPLLGNHEEMLLTALESQPALRYWLHFGGAAALSSYGYDGSAGLCPADLYRFISSEHIQFLRTCRDYFEGVHHFFVHAYYEPHLPLAQQNWNGLRWTTLPSVPQPHDSGKIAIVGHTPQYSGEVLDVGFLKCLDTNCQRGGWLTALDVQTGQIWQADKDGNLR